MNEPEITVHFWAAARAAAGTGELRLPVEGPVTLADVVRRVVAERPETRLAGVLEVCSVLVGERPVTTRDPAQVWVEPGETVEFLPPFAGG
ncbi:MoaD/ThiS family protein [Nocardioides coralli]|uniref:MoaD/ThiS family protein n=1 Tax=Nocardioides coralli TaxID=2872154 RepID=UPI001CA412E0|nr:MoaD/ThiS family protein [Nocardioides coralli]QZY28806.1 MoaD/ThiS family protein [Nocardioides coralli]